MQFQHMRPESQAAPPRLRGEVDISQTVLAKLRLFQLRDLARAFEIEVDMDAPKSSILPALMAAEARGVFRGNPSRPYYLLRAGRTPDDPPVEHDDVFDDQGRYRTQEAPVPPAEISYTELQKRVHEIRPEFQVVGAKREILESILEEYHANP